MIERLRIWYWMRRCERAVCALWDSPYQRQDALMKARFYRDTRFADLVKCEALYYEQKLKVDRAADAKA